MKLSQKHRDILQCIQLRADLSIVELSKLLPYKISTVRYCLKELLENDIIVKKVMIDQTCLGFTPYSLLLGLASQDNIIVQRLIDFLEKAPQVSWVAGIGGNYQLEITFLARHCAEVEGFLNSLSEEAAVTFKSKAISVEPSLYLFGLGFLSTRFQKATPIFYRTNGRIIPIDDVDNRIMHGLANFGCLSYSDLARRLGFPKSTIIPRIEKLKNQGVICGEYYYPNYKELGLQSYHFMVSARRLNKRFLQDFYEYSSNHRNIEMFIRCVGSWDFELIVQVTEQEDIEEITNDINRRFSNFVDNLSIFPRFKVYKSVPYPLLNLIGSSLQLLPQCRVANSVTFLRTT